MTIGRRRLNSRSMMIGTTLLALAVFYLYFLIFPIGYALFGSFHIWNPMIGQMKPAGLFNYNFVLKSAVFQKALGNTLAFTAVVSFARLALGLMLAVLVYDLGRGKGFFKTVLFLPVVTSMISIALVFMWIFEPSTGVVNAVLNFLRLPSLGWLKDQHLALPTIMITTIWKDTGFAMVLYLAGLGSISPSLFEAADVDGASFWQKFWHIKVPMLMPTTVLVGVTGIIGYIQMFDQVYMMTEKAGPNNATLTAVYFIFDEAFVNFRFGTASVATFVIFLLTFVFSMLQMRLQRNS